MDPKDLPAFPALMKAGDLAVSEGGMTLRDYFAAKAMAATLGGIVASGSAVEAKHHEGLAKTAYVIADAMLAAREAA